MGNSVIGTFARIQIFLLQYPTYLFPSKKTGSSFLFFTLNLSFFCHLGGFMQQLDLFRDSSSDYLYGEIEKIRSSLDRRSRAMFAIISELQDQLMALKQKESKDDRDDV